MPVRVMITREPVVVRVEPVVAGRAPPDREDVVVIRTRRDRIVRAAVSIGRKIESVPVHGGRLRQVVAEMDDYPVALVYLQSGTGNTAVVSVDIGGRAGEQREARRRGRERDLDHPRDRRA